MNIFIPKQQITVRQEGAAVVLLDAYGHIIGEPMPWKAALAVSKVIRHQAKKAEEYDKALQIIDDQAVLMRARFPLGLTNNNDMLNEARKEAHWNSDLRRYLPHIEPTMVVYSPSIIKHPPKKGVK